MQGASLSEVQVYSSFTGPLVRVTLAPGPRSAAREAPHTLTSHRVDQNSTAIMATSSWSVVMAVVVSGYSASMYAFERKQ